MLLELSLRLVMKRDEQVIDPCGRAADIPIQNPQLLLNPAIVNTLLIKFALEFTTSDSLVNIDLTTCEVVWMRMSSPSLYTTTLFPSFLSLHHWSRIKPIL
jgi:hypothetical protein